MEVEDVFGPFLSEVFADALGLGFGVGDHFFVLDIEHVDFFDVVPGLHHALVGFVVAAEPVEVVGLGVRSCEGLGVVGEAGVLWVAAAVDDLGAGEESCDEGDIEGVVGLFVGDDAFFGDFVVEDCGAFCHFVDDALVVDEAGDWECSASGWVWE